MSRKLIIEGNAVYEIDEDCMLKKRLDAGFQKEEKKQKERRKENDAKGKNRCP